MINYENNVNANLIIPIEATVAVDNPVYRRIVASAGGMPPQRPTTAR